MSDLETMASEGVEDVNNEALAASEDTNELMAEESTDEAIEAAVEPEAEETEESEGAVEVPHVDSDVPKGVQKKINREVAKRKAAEERLMALEADIKAAQLSQYKDVDPYTGEAIVAPCKEDYVDNPLDYIDALQQHQVKQEQSRQFIEQQKVADQQLQKKKMGFEAQRELAREKYEDFDEIDHMIQSNPSAVPLSEVVVEAVFESKHGADMYYWLGKNPQKAHDLYQLSQQNSHAAAREMGKIEAQFTKPKKLQSKAPKPISVGNGDRKGSRSTVDKMETGDIRSWLKSLG